VDRRYEQFPHTADIGVKVYGSSLKELFENAAFAMFDIIADLEGLKSSVEQAVEIEGKNYEELLVAWLDELLYNFYTKGIIYFRFEIEDLKTDSLKAKVYGRPVGDNRNRLNTEIKAATYHDLKIKNTAKGYEVSIIFDI
jgi:SHS2 domain-containing protein